jgi:hypothetical protein
LFAGIRYFVLCDAVLQSELFVLKINHCGLRSILKCFERVALSYPVMCDPSPSLFLPCRRNHLPPNLRSILRCHCNLPTSESDRLTREESDQGGVCSLFCVPVLKQVSVKFHVSEKELMQHFVNIKFV